MSDEKKYTERELILAKREGYMRHCEKFCARINKEEANVSAVVEYPLPKVTRPRVVKDSVGMEFRFIADNQPPLVEWRNTLTEEKLWRVSTVCNGVAVNAERAKLWADLVANPTEEVDA